MKRARYYCTLCWQEFDVIEQHNAASATTCADNPGFWGTREFAERINGSCPGDIHIRPLYRPSKKPETGPRPELPFSGEPLHLGNEEEPIHSGNEEGQ